MNRKIHINSYINEKAEKVNCIEIDDIIIECISYDDDTYLAHVTDRKRFVKMRVNKLIIDDLMKGSCFYTEWMYQTVIDRFNKIKVK